MLVFVVSGDRRHLDRLGELKWNLDEGQLRSELAAIFNPRPEDTPEEPEEEVAAGA
jgi:hypothetical protein